jgi:hypothetical protein
MKCNLFDLLEPTFFRNDVRMVLSKNT